MRTRTTSAFAHVILKIAVRFRDKTFGIRFGEVPRVVAARLRIAAPPIVSVIVITIAIIVATVVIGLIVVGIIARMRLVAAFGTRLLGARGTQERHTICPSGGVFLADRLGAMGTLRRRRPVTFVTEQEAGFFVALIWLPFFFRHPLSPVR